MNNAINKTKTFGTVLAKNRNIVLITFLLLSVRWSLADHYFVPSGSMQPSIQPGDQVMVNKAAYGMRIPFTQVFLSGPKAPLRGDVVVVLDPNDEGRRLVKRVIGLPGDKIFIKDGYIAVNGAPLAKLPSESTSNSRRNQHTSESALFIREILGDRNYLVRRHPYRVKHESYSLEVPQGHLFLLGDNRDNSFDSRYFGPVKISSLLGRAEAVAVNISKKPPFFAVRATRL